MFRRVHPLGYTNKVHAQFDRRVGLHYNVVDSNHIMMLHHRGGHYHQS